MNYVFGCQSRVEVPRLTYDRASLQLCLLLCCLFRFELNALWHWRKRKSQKEKVRKTLNILRLDVKMENGHRLADIIDCVNAGGGCSLMSDGCEVLLIVPLQCCSIKSTWKTSPLVSYEFWLHTDPLMIQHLISESLTWGSTWRHIHLFFHYLFSFSSPGSVFWNTGCFIWLRQQQHLQTEKTTQFSINKRLLKNEKREPGGARVAAHTPLTV